MEAGTRGYLRGNEVTWNGERWILPDGTDAASRPLRCPACSLWLTFGEPDACIGMIHAPGLAGACCGHGVHLGYVNWDAVGVGPEWQAGAYVESA